MEQAEIDFSLWGKGSGSSGILNNTSEDEKTFVPLKLQFDVKDIQVSSSFIMALSQKNALYVWGIINVHKIAKPLKMHYDKVQQISCGWDHALFTTHNRVYGLGSNVYLQLGFGCYDKYFEKPVEIILQPVLFIAAGFRQSYIMKKDCLMGCGQSKKYQLGKVNNKVSTWNTIYQGNIGQKIIKMICGKRFVLFLTEKHQVFALGYNQQNCFNVKKTHFSEPTLIFTQVEQISCGWAHITLLKIDKTVQSYGRNNLGQLGHGKQTNKITFQLHKDEYIDKIESGSEFTFAISDQYRLFGWGWNQHYNITQSDSKILPFPIQINHPLKKCKNIWTNPALTIIQGPS